MKKRGEGIPGTLFRSISRVGWAAEQYRRRLNAELEGTAAAAVVDWGARRRCHGGLEDYRRPQHGPFF